MAQNYHGSLHSSLNDSELLRKQGLKRRVTHPRVLKHSSCVTLIFQVACGRLGCELRSAILKFMRMERLLVDAFTRTYTATRSGDEVPEIIPLEIRISQGLYFQYSHVMRECDVGRLISLYNGRI